MPVIEKPNNAPPPFGGRTLVFIGGGLAQQLREWQQRKREVAPPAVDEEH